MRHDLDKRIRAHEDITCRLFGAQIGMTYTGHGNADRAITRDYFKYTVIMPGNCVIEGDDYSPSPLYCWDDKRNIAALLGWLIVQPGDTDEDFFAHHTPEHMAWLESSDCEELTFKLYDYEASL